MSGGPGAKIVWSLVALLGILHYDFWYWSDTSLVLGFMPVGLFYQAFISVAAAVLWALVVRYAWPDWIEQWAEGDGPAGTDAS